MTVRELTYSWREFTPMDLTPISKPEAEALWPYGKRHRGCIARGEAYWAFYPEGVRCTGCVFTLSFSDLE